MYVDIRAVALGVAKEGQGSDGGAIKKVIQRTGGGVRGGGWGWGGWKEGLQYMSRGVTSEMILHMNFPHPLKCYGVRRTCRSVSAAYVGGGGGGGGGTYVPGRRGLGAPK